MAASVLVFAMALSVAMFAFTATSNAAHAISYYADESNYYSNLRLNGDLDYNITRVVRSETIIPTLYRYYKENFSVRFYDDRPGQNHKLIQLFDVNTEGKVRAAIGKRKPTPEDERLIAEFNDASKSTYLFGAPWMDNTIKHTKTRVDLFVSGTTGFINDVKVDYSNVGNGKKGLKYYIEELDNSSNYHTFNINGQSVSIPRYVFVETFVKYTFTGDTISVDEGDGLETITGSKKTEDKIDIIYTIMENPEYTKLTNP
jgi:hypothetical protein